MYRLPRCSGAGYVTPLPDSLTLQRNTTLTRTSLYFGGVISRRRARRNGRKKTGSGGGERRATAIPGITFRHGKRSRRAAIGPRWIRNLGVHLNGRGNHPSPEFHKFRDPRPEDFAESAIARYDGQNHCPAFSFRRSDLVIKIPPRTGVQEEVERLRVNAAC